MMKATCSRRSSGFTLVELLMVIVVIALLVALLLPAVNAALRKTREAATGSEINMMAQALSDFKSKYGDYPPSRILLCENGDYSSALTTNQSLAPSGTSTADITTAQLAARSLAALRKFWPRIRFTTIAGSPVWPSGSSVWYDFNGNGIFDQQPYLLDGRQCLAFFLGGIPTYGGKGAPNGNVGNFAGGMSGFSRDQFNPFKHDIAPIPPATDPMYNNNRQSPFFEFKGNRLVMLPAGNAGFPGYIDTSSSKNNPSFYAYFSTFGGVYDPNDVNVSEVDDETGVAFSLRFRLPFPTYAAGGSSQTVGVSPPPNPYTLTPTFSGTSGTVTYHKPQTFQIISPGADQLYGLGGQYVPDATAVLPVNAAAITPTSSGSSTPGNNIRQSERDNVGNFHGSRLN